MYWKLLYHNKEYNIGGKSIPVCYIEDIGMFPKGIFSFSFYIWSIYLTVSIVFSSFFFFFFKFIWFLCVSLGKFTFSTQKNYTGGINHMVGRCFHIAVRMIFFKENYCHQNILIINIFNELIFAKVNFILLPQRITHNME